MPRLFQIQTLDTCAAPRIRGEPGTVLDVKTKHILWIGKETSNHTEHIEYSGEETNNLQTARNKAAAETIIQTAVLASRRELTYLINIQKKKKSCVHIKQQQLDSVSRLSTHSMNFVLLTVTLLFCA